ncbi:MAG: iron ABC transporter permease [Clostridiaceae bacterium]
MTLKKENKINIILGVLLCILIVISLILGKYNIPWDMFLKAITGKEVPETISTVIFNIRIPRIMGAVFIGASLSTAGAAYQGMFKNPMVSPDILGASSGAAFGAALGILFSFNIVAIQMLSFVFGVLAVCLTYVLSLKVSKNTDITIVLILIGILISTLFSSFVSLIKFIADPYGKLPDITFWLMGSLTSINNKDIYIAIVPIIIGISTLLCVKWKLNLMCFGEEEAKSMGINTGKLRTIVIIASTMVVASSVSIGGVIGWNGLVIPHFARMLVGANYKYLLTTSMLLGGGYLLLIDNLARNISSTEIPIGILTSLIGVPCFIYLMMKAKREWV